MHYQFEAIHPFTDGNGRTGRALVQAMLRRGGVTTSVTAPVSAGLLHDVERYFAALTSYRAGDVEPIVTVFAEAATAAVRNGAELADDIRGVRARYDHALAGLRSHSGARKATEALFEHPVVNAELVANRGEMSMPAAYRALEALVERGIVVPGHSKKRNRVWVAVDITDALDRFAARAGRRARP